MVPDYSKLFLDPKIDYPVLSPNLSFSEYIQQCKAIIKNTRLDLETHAEQIINANAPFELYPTSETNNTKIKYGALLIHGLLDSPFTMRDIGTQLQADGLLVRAVLLPGHGTIPGALLNTDYKQWIETIHYAVETLAQEVEQIFLVGFSTGGSLALYHAAKNPEKIAGIILLSPALKINCPLDFLANWPAALGKIYARAAWFRRDRQETLDYVKYRSTPFNAAYQVYQVAKEVDQLNRPRCPLFFALPTSDVTVTSEVSIQYFLADPNPKNRMILYSKHPAQTEYDNRILIRPSSYPELNIFDFSHSTIPIAPSNPHYGKNGDYAEASHVDENTNVLYDEYYIPTMDFHNLLFKLKLARYRYQRLSFNPDFAFLGEEIKRFISLPPVA